jgi:anti-sigma factor RsiW
MDYDAQLKLQAYLDGELSEADARQIADRLAEDSQQSALLGELRQTRNALAGFEDGIALPESRDFYWSKIRREIERRGPETEKPEPGGSWAAWLRRLLMPATGLALLMVAVLLLLPAEHVPAMETALADSGAMIYHDYSAGATFVWLPYPADNDRAEDAN